MPCLCCTYHKWPLATNNPSCQSFYSPEDSLAIWTWVINYERRRCFKAYWEWMETAEATRMCFFFGRRSCAQHCKDTQGRLHWVCCRLWIESGVSLIDLQSNQGAVTCWNNSCYDGCGHCYMWQQLFQKHTKQGKKKENKQASPCGDWSICDIIYTKRR